MRKIIAVLFAFLISPLFAQQEVNGIWLPNIPIANPSSNFICDYGAAGTNGQCLYNLIYTFNSHCPTSTGTTVSRYGWVAGEVPTLGATVYTPYYSGTCNGLAYVPVGQVGTTLYGDLVCPAESQRQGDGVSCKCPFGTIWMQDEGHCGGSSTPVNNSTFWPVLVEPVTTFEIPCNGSTSASTPFSLDLPAFSDKETQNVWITALSFANISAMSFVYDDSGNYYNFNYTVIPPGKSCSRACRPTPGGISAEMSAPAGVYFRWVLRGTMYCAGGVTQNPIYINVNDEPPA